MALHNELLISLFLYWCLFALSPSLNEGSIPYNITKPRCQATCGNLSIPYPFGTTEGCALNDNFIVTCNESAIPLRPLLWSSSSNILTLNISLDGELLIQTFVGKDCYNIKWSSPWYKNFKFPFSYTRNKFFALGCDTRAFISNEDVTVGCSSICKNPDSIHDGFCSGIGCCQTSIPKELFGFSANVTSYYNYTDVMDFNPCSYTFLTEEKYFNFSKAYLANFTDDVVPSVLDWAVGNQTCKEATKNITGAYLCQRNSNCSDSDNGPGYRCYCKPGYQGNPYLPLPDGCIDINECDDPNLNNCVNQCKNTEGNFTCTCPKWYIGDGMKGKKGCVPDLANIMKIVIGGGVGLIVLAICSSWLYWGFKKRKLMQLKHKFFERNGGSMLQQELLKREAYSETAKIYRAEELEQATNKYDKSRIVGQGGFGTVYKGILADDRVVAIKKSKLVDQSQIEQFINEIVVLSQINHRNVVRLLGCCLETEVPLLVYEFVSNGTLFEHIHEQPKAFAMPWNTRLKIAAETAGVLSYLHSAAAVPIIHRDVKSTNILLDENYMAKVSDFGASRLIPIDQIELSTLVQGTLGYLDPEYLVTSQLTDKSDVYSFGVVLVELLTGKMPLSFDRPEAERSLANYFLKSMKEGRLFEVLEDCDALKAGSSDQIKEVANVAKMCLRLKGEERPSMKEVATELEGIVRKMENQYPWVHVATTAEDENQYLLGVGETTGKYGEACIANSSIVYDSIRDHVELSVSYGR